MVWYSLIIQDADETAEYLISECVTMACSRQSVLNREFLTPDEVKKAASSCGSNKVLQDTVK